MRILALTVSISASRNPPIASFAIKAGAAPSIARQSGFTDVTHTLDIQLERDIDRRVLQILERDGGLPKKISRREFAAATELYKTLAGGALTDEEARLLVKRLMEANLFRPQRGGLTFSRRWYKTIGETKRQSLLPALLNRQL